MTSELKSILFLDIETIRGVERFDQLNERLKPQWARKAAFLKRDEHQTDGDLYHDRAGIYAEFGKVIVIAMGKYTEDDKGQLGLKTRVLAGDDEKKLLLEFKSLLEKMDNATRLCAHNGKEFDFPYLSRRMLINDILPPDLLNQSGRKPWEVSHLDTMELWKFGDYKHYTSLDLLAALFNIPTSKGVMDGSMVNTVYYEEKNLGKIAEYCVGDVVAIAQLYLKFKGMPLLAPHLIH
ncbi:MAG: 3'-5' exonuclease [Cyclobacteriaceae bacterium]|jgi:predicted PolB exonuclease-like 3'-5' exonuclease